MILAATVCAGLALLPCLAAAETVILPHQRPEEVGLSSDRLELFDALAARAVEDRQIAGVVAWVLRRGSVVHESVHGTLDVETGAPMRSDSIFRIASGSKLVLSVATLSLVEEGRLLLSDPVSRYLPAYESTTVAVLDADGVHLEPAVRQITVLDLLTHTSGIPSYEDLPPAHQKLWQGSSWSQGLLQHQSRSIEELAQELAGLPFLAQPGTRFVYGAGTDVLGAVLEKAAGQPLDQLLETRVLEPLHMHDTHFYLPPEKASRLAANHNPYATEGLRRAPDDDREWTGQGAFVTGPRRAFAGGGGLLSTAPDFARLLAMLAGGGALGDVRVLSPASVRLLTTNHVAALYAEEHGFSGMGFGFNVEVKLEPRAAGWDVPQMASVGTFGWGGALASTFWVDPERALIGVFMIQVRPSRIDLHKRFANIVYGALLDPGAE